MESTKLYFVKLCLRNGEFAGVMPSVAGTKDLLYFYKHFGRAKVDNLGYGKSLSIKDKQDNRILLVNEVNNIAAAQNVQMRYEDRQQNLIAWYLDSRFEYPKSELWD